MRHKCLVLYRNSLLAQVVVTLLETDQRLQLEVADIARVDPMAAVRAANPEVVILDITNLEGLAEFLRTLLRERHDTKILFLDPLANAVHVLTFRYQEIWAAQDFFSTLWEALPKSPGEEDAG